MPASRTSPCAGRRRTRCGRCSGVQSRASRTVAGVPANGVGDGAADGDGAGRGRPSRRHWVTAVGVGPPAPMQPATSRQATDERRRARVGGASRGLDSVSERRRRRPGDSGTAFESHGPASFAGMSQIRFGGSVVEPHSQRVRAPRRRYSVVASDSSTERSQATTSAMTASPSGSLWVSWRRPGYVRRVTLGNAASGSLDAVGTSRSSPPWIDERRERQAVRARPDAGLLGERLGAEPRRRAVVVQRIGEVALARPPGRATGSSRRTRS